MVLQLLDPPFQAATSPAAAIRRRAGAGARGFAARWGLLIGFVVLWQVSSTRGWVNPAVFPPLDTIAAALWKGLASGALLDDIAISLRRSGIAFGAAVALDVASVFVYDEAHAATDAQPLVSLGRLRAREPRVAQAIRLLEGSLDRPLSSDAIARRVASRSGRWRRCSGGCSG